MTLNLSHKAVLMMLVVAIVPLLSMWFLNYHSNLTHLNQSVDQQLISTSERLVSTVNDWVTTNHKMLRQASSLPDMVSMNPRLQTPVLKSIRDEYSWSFLVFTVRPDGANVARSDDKEPPYYGDRAYFKQVMEGAPLGRQVVISRTSGQPTLVLAVPIQTTDGRTVGVLATSTSLAELSEIVTKSKIGKTGYAFLLDEDGKVVAHYQQAYVNSSADFSKHPAFRGLAGEASRRLVYQEEGRDIVAYAQKTQHGWTMVVQRDYDDAYSAIGDANSQAFSLLVLTLAAVTVLAIVLARRLAGPIRRLTLIADEISRGRLDIAITEVGRKDEIGALAAAIDRMASGIRVSIHKLRRVR